jgi:methylamine dehydrogenase accessory protein MauD
VVLAAVFAAAGVAKLLDLPGSRGALAGFGVPARIAPTAAVLVPIAELTSAIALVPEESARWGGLAALVLLLAFVAGISNAMRRGEAPDCHCFGQLHSEPAGRPTLIRNLGLAVLAAVVVIDGPGPSIGSWVSDRSAAELAAVGLGAAAVTLAIVAAQLWLDVRELTSDLESAKRGLAGQAAGLAVGSPAPEFSLPDLSGRTRTLEALRSRGRPVLLAFTSPDCGPCQSVYPELGRWSASLANELTVAVITRGTPDDNRPIAEEHGIGTMLMQENMETMRAYQTNATPTLVVVNPDGTIGSPLVNDVISIEPLVRLTLQRSRRVAPAGEPSGRA